MPSAPASEVLDDDNLLIEILVRVGFPTTLVLAALVCRRWYHHASDPAFLRRFRKLHPPQLLGFYHNPSDALGPPAFVPMLLETPELAAVVRRVAGYNFSAYGHSLIRIKNCQNGSISTTVVHVYNLQDGAWCKHASVMTKLTGRPRWELKAVLVDNKIYVLADPRDIIVLDLMNSGFSRIQLPQGVDHGSSDIGLSSWADDATGVYLINVKELQVHIWLHKGGNWMVVDTICLRMLDHTFEHKHSAHLKICLVGDNAEFVLLQMGECTLYLDIKCRALRKMHERTGGDCLPLNFQPLMMIWPPSFPTLENDPTRFAFWPSDDMCTALVEVTYSCALHHPLHSCGMEVLREQEYLHQPCISDKGSIKEEQ
ncbi:uncharacterized protein [Lolium perenne]|uniref:uncharacterized protein n=1 Tax=Lolium perenne TaxID=4522 RepID=UPI0021F5559F|nr:uncharacterized protein LOC127310654 [Lolium perenne]